MLSRVRSIGSAKLLKFTAVISLLLCGCSESTNEGQGIVDDTRTVVGVMVTLNERRSFRALVTTDKQSLVYQSVVASLPPPDNIGVVETHFSSFRVVTNPKSSREDVLIPDNYSNERRWVSVCPRLQYQNPKEGCIFAGMVGSRAVQILGEAGDLSSFDKLQVKVADAIAASDKYRELDNPK